MANEMILTKFSHFKEANEHLSQEIIADIQSAIQTTGNAHLLLSGGSTPGPLYERLNTQIDDFSNIDIGLVDERFVVADDDNSNERLLRNSFSKASKITGLVYADDDYEKNLSLAIDHNQQFLKKTDLLVLGMGTDGHIASLFPGDSATEKSEKSNQKTLINTTAPASPKQRISYTYSAILDVKKVYLLIVGSEKLKVLENSNLNLPVHRIIREIKNLKVYYAENK